MAIAGSSERGVRKWLLDASDAFISVLFPAGCRICQQLLPRASQVPICETCLASFKAPPERKCENCWQPIVGLTSAEGASLVCRFCQGKKYAFQRARSYGIYEGGLAKAILFLKWEKMEPLGKWFAERLAELTRSEGEKLAADVVVPVPLHSDRERERGYNQAGLISKPLARKLRLPHQAVLLVRTRPRPNKQILSLEERWESVRGAFATRPGSQVDNKRVLLVDDVMTTGATLDACARALLESGAKSVIGVTVARAASPLPAARDDKL